MKKLGARISAMSLSVEGIGTNETKIRHRTTVQLQSTVHPFTTDLEAHIIPKIVSDQPAQGINISNWDIPAHIKLADPEFDKPGTIDCLLEAELFYELLRNGQIKMADNLPSLQNTAHGRIVAVKVTKCLFSNFEYILVISIVN